MKLWLLNLTLSLAAAIACAAGTDSSTATKVQLRESASIHGEIIHLSDLLPADAPAALKAASSTIALGRAPLPGSIRVLQVAELSEKLSDQGKLLAQLSLPASISVRRSGWPIQRQAVQTAVANFLQQQGWRASDVPKAAALSGPPVIALTPDPVLEVTGYAWDPRLRRLQLQLRCAERLHCGSFLVLASSPHPVLPMKMSHSKKSPVSGGQPSLWRTAATRPSVAGPPLTQPGDLATLIFENHHLRISLPVICLQRGFLRQEIRARDASGQRIYHAEVIGADRLRAPL